MLDFDIEDNLYVITERILSFHGHSLKKVYYTLDLKQKRVNNECWRETDTMDRSWFRKYYMKHFPTIKD